MAAILRQYQEAAIERVREAAVQGARSICLVAPTGSGKTIIGAELIRRAVGKHKRAVWMVHRTELVDQAADALAALGLAVGVVSAASTRRADPHAPVQVASLGTLVARGELPPADLLIFDECHHARASSYEGIVRAYHSATVIGLTATPERGDGRGLGDLFKRLVVVAKISELISAGHLVDCDVVAPSEMLRPGKIAQSPVDAYLEHAAGTSAIVFTESLEHAAAVAGGFFAAGVGCSIVEAGTPAVERARTMCEFRAGRLLVLVNCMVLSEGFDAPNASTCILARGCGTAGLYLQMVGRVLRPAPGKHRALLVDLRGVSHIHGHPCDDRVYSLDGRGIRRDGGATGDAQGYCRVCGAPILSTGEGCFECGTLARQPRPLTVTGDPLVRYAAARRQPSEKRKENLRRWLATAAARGYRPGWAYAKYRAVYGSWP